MIDRQNLSILVTKPDGTNIFTIVDILPNLSKLKELIKKSSITLDQDKSYTLFAPTNFAIESFEKKNGKIDETQKASKSFVNGHIIEGKFLFNHLRQLWEAPIKVKSLSGDLITLGASGDQEPPLEFSVMGGKAIVHDIELKSESDPKKGGLIYLLDSIIAHKGTLYKTYILKCIL